MTSPLSAIHHVTLNVRDVDTSAAWYARVLGFEPLREIQAADFRRVILRHPGGQILGLNRHDHAEADDAYSYRRAGVDHVAFALDGEAAMTQWLAHLDAHGVAHNGIQEGAAGARLIAIRDPDGIQLELFLAG